MKKNLYRRYLINLQMFLAKPAENAAAVAARRDRLRRERDLGRLATPAHQG